MEGNRLLLRNLGVYLPDVCGRMSRKAVIKADLSSSYVNVRFCLSPISQEEYNLWCKYREFHVLRDYRHL
jgi:hypothetical protein